MDLNHRTLLRLTLRGPLSWAYCHCGQAGRRDAHFVRCNSNRRSYQETFPIICGPSDPGVVKCKLGHERQVLFVLPLTVL